MNRKICSKCGVKKYLTDFYTQLDAKDGRRSVCKVCYRKSRNKGSKKKSKDNYEIRHKDAEKFPYNGFMMTVRQIFDLPDCDVSRTQLRNNLHAGIPLPDAMRRKKNWSHDSVKMINGEFTTKTTKNEVKKVQLIPDCKNTGYTKEQMIKIMSVPVNPNKCVFHAAAIRYDKEVRKQGGTLGDRE